MDKPNLEFICTSPGVEQIMPIIRTSEHKHSWIAKAVADMKSNGSIAAAHRRDWEMGDVPDMQSPNKDKEKEERHTAKCPSLQMAHNTGWILIHGFIGYLSPCVSARHQFPNTNVNC